MNYKKLVVIAAVIIIGMIFLYRIRERTNEEYVSIFLENREDFDYIAEMMKQWPDMSIIDFEGGISSEDQIIADEIENNIEFYEHLKNLYDLKEISDVVKWKGEIEFSFSKPPKDYHGGWFYWENMEDKGIMTVNKIDEHWTLVMLPNV